MDAEKSNSIEDSKELSILSQDTSIVKTVWSNILPLRRYTIENILIVWLDSNADYLTDDYQNTLTQLRTIVSNVYTYNDLDECVDFLTDIRNERVFMVIANTSDQHIMSVIHDIPHLEMVYVLCDDTLEHDQTNIGWLKFKYLKASTTSVYETFSQVVRQYKQDTIAISFIESNEHTVNQNFDQLEPSFMYTLIFKEILLEMEYDQQAVNNLVEVWRKQYSDNGSQLKMIDDFKTTYCPQRAIWWYTCVSFVYEVLNQALRMLESDLILNMGFFVHDLHREIEHLHQKQISSYNGTPFIVYRGQGLSVFDFEKLKKTKDGLMSFNNFLSTSRDRAVAYMLAESNAAKPETIGILFEMTIDPLISSTPFAIIDDISNFEGEKEVLFSMHAVFRINPVIKMEGNSQLYQVNLTLTADNDQQLRILTDHIRKETAGTTGFHRLGLLLTKIGRYDKAEELCKALIDQTFNQGEKILQYNNLAYMKKKQGDLDNALSIYKKVIEVFEQSLSLDHSILADSYNNIGAVYFDIEKYSEALSAFEKALEIRQKISPSNGIDIAQSYNNIGGLYDKKGEYSKALPCYEKSCEIYRQNLPLNHPDLATLYNNIGHVLDNMGNYSQALLSYKNALEIVEKSLHSNHPDFAQSYNNIGRVYHHAGQYSEALSYYEKALKFRQKIFPPNHIDIGQSYNNIGGLYDKKGEYLMALSCYDKAVVIFEQNLPSDHLDLATLYNNICGVLGNIGQYSKALYFQEKALKIEEKILPSNHPSLATSYNNIGLVYYNTGKYSESLAYYEKALQIRQQMLPSNHPDLAQSYHNIGGVFKRMEKYRESVLFHEKAIAIFETTVPANYPELVNIYNNTGLVYRNMNDYMIALSYYEKALEIGKQHLPQNHPFLAKTYNNMGLIYYYRKSFSKALACLKYALDIFQKLLPAGHPDIRNVRRNIEAIQQEL